MPIRVIRVVTETQQRLITSASALHEHRSEWMAALHEHRSEWMAALLEHRSEWMAALHKHRRNRDLLKLHFLSEVSSSIKFLSEFRSDSSLFV